MALFTPSPRGADNFACFHSHSQKASLSPPRTTPLLPLFNNRLHHSQLHSFPSLKFRVLCSIKEKENLKETDEVTTGVLTGLRVNDLDQLGSGPEESGSGKVGSDWDWPPWQNIPERYKLIGTTSLAFVICNMDKVNLSIAIIPMSHQFGWNSSVAGLVQSSFFWGYALSQLPGGWLAKIFGGRKVLEIGVLTWSLATALVPLLAGFMPGLILSRILVGIGEGVSPSAATDLIARTIPLEERSRAVGFVFGGLSVGSVAGLLLAPPIIQNIGWGSVFYIFGLLGLAWFLGFQFLKEGNASFTAEPISWSQSTSRTQTENSSLRELGGSLKEVPWKSFFQSQAVWAMIYTHFCGSWGHYTCLSWLPTYFSEELNLNLTEAAWVSILPPLASIFVTSIAAQVADQLIANGVETTTVRKICQSIAFLSPAICMTLSSLDLGLPPWEIVGLLTGGLALSSFALSGLYCTHQDISPEYASILLMLRALPYLISSQSVVLVLSLLFIAYYHYDHFINGIPSIKGITNTVGAVPGIVGVALTGYLLDSTHSWSISLFAPSIFFYLSGTLVWLVFASSKPQTFSETD